MDKGVKITLVGVGVLVLLVIVAGILLVGVVLPRLRADAQMSMCAANLNAVGKGIQLYLTEADDKFPLMYEEGDLMADLNSSTDSDDLSALNTNAMQNVWLMIHSGSIQEEHFKCPSDGQWRARIDIEPGATVLRYGWNSWQNFSVGMHKPYGEDHESPLTANLRGSFPIFADKNFQADGQPGTVYYTTSSDRRVPGNHGGLGFNYLLYGSACGKARYENEPGRYSTCGTSDDDIYVAQDDGSTKAGTTDPSADPDIDTDTFILPWTPGR